MSREVREWAGTEAEELCVCSFHDGQIDVSNGSFNAPHDHEVGVILDGDCFHYPFRMTADDARRLATSLLVLAEKADLSNEPSNHDDE